MPRDNGGAAFHPREDISLDVFKDAGFETVLTVPFSDPHYGGPEHLCILAHRDGLLARYDTIGGQDRINSASVWYNWRPDKSAEWWRLTSSGHLTEGDVWIGDHDARWGMRHNLQCMREAGMFVVPWVEQPFLWLLHYGDTADPNYDYRAINRERYALLPEWVKAFAGPEYDRAARAHPRVFSEADADAVMADAMVEAFAKARAALAEPAKPSEGVGGKHKWVPSTLGHGEQMCEYCYGTNRELALLGLLDHCDKAPAAPTLSPPVQAEAGWQPTHRHVKRGSEYQLLGTGKMQTETWQEPVPFTRLGLVNPVDMREVAVYLDKDGDYWVRPREEFEDGRFVPALKQEGV